MAPLHAGRPRDDPRDPEELVQALEDAALDRTEESRGWAGVETTKG